MNALTQVIDYLSKKISSVNLNNQKANTGGVLIKTHDCWEEKLDKIVMLSFQIIQSQFSRNNTTYTVGECGLTYCSMAIGKIVAGVVQREPLKNKRHQLALGDLMIEGFLYHGFAELVAPTRRNESYILKAAPKWVELREMDLSLVKQTIIGSIKDKPAAPEMHVHKAHSQLFNEDTPYVRAIDKLQQVKWCINLRVLETVRRDWPTYEDPIPDNDAKEQRRRSKVIERQFIFNKAEALKDWDGFYQLFEVDYRGRMYNTEPFLNFQGNDLAKGMLMFHEPKPINEDGKFWLAVHTAASYNQSYAKDDLPDWCEEDYKSHLESEGLDDISVDKMTLNDRANWTVNNMDAILEWAAADAIQFNSEKPVTFLACCYEWVMVNACGLTCIPIPIDGSNNGWQHLGAISKDQHTGNLVGLTPTVIQKDFYVQTAKELINLTTDERLLGILNSMPMKHIRKGISKRGSMTRAYSAGAGKIGENMFFDCKTEDFHEKYGLTLKDCNKLAKILIKAIQNVCPGPLRTMAYLQELAAFELGKHQVVGPGSEKEFKDMNKRRFELICIKGPSDEELQELNDISIKREQYSYELYYGNGKDYITWDTPSGFTALYEKYTMTDIKERATINGKQVKHVLKTPTDRPDIQGFMCGISPNYIHSMDAAHMALVIADWEGDFGAVHDSFSTHASDVDELLQKTKQTFIDMYSHDNYFDVIKKQLTNETDSVDQPALGTLDIGGINDSDYFFA